VAELPRLLDPPHGFAAAANARVNPAGAAPLVSADNAPGYRIRRIVSVLAGSVEHTPEAMRVLQMDWHNGQAERLLPALLAALEGERLAGAAASAHEVLRHWRDTPVNGPGMAAPLLFECWYLELAETLFAQRLGEELWAQLLRHNYLLNHALDPLILAAPRSPWWRGDRDARLREAFLAAVDALTSELGGKTGGWRWDSRQAVHLDHQLAQAVPLLRAWLSRGPFRWGGGVATVGRAGYRYHRPAVVNHGATVRVVAEMTTPMKVWAVIPGGQSGHPLDPHYDDQIDEWLRGESQPLASHFDDAVGPTLELRPAAADGPSRP
jgi:penicillin amidase